MINFKDFDETRLPDYSLEDLKGFVNQIEMMKSVISEDCSSEMAEYLKDDKFDIYSRGGAKKIKKIADKYAVKFVGANEYLKILGEEIAKREQYEEEMRYSGKRKTTPKEESQEDFLRKEEDKTWVYRSKIE